MGGALIVPIGKAFQAERQTSRLANNPFWEGKLDVYRSPEIGRFTKIAFKI